MKEFGKLTTEQLKEFIAYIPRLLVMFKDLHGELSRVPAAKFDAALTNNFGSYSAIYEVPFVTHVAALVFALNRQEELAAMAAMPDPQQAILDDLRRKQEDDKAHNPLFHEGEVIGLVYSFGRTFQSLTTYGRSISSLLASARERNDQEALFKAIRMDRAVVSDCHAIYRKGTVTRQQGFLWAPGCSLRGTIQKAVARVRPDALHAGDS